MSRVTILAGSIPYTGGQTALRLRGWARRDFTTSDGRNIYAGQVGSADHVIDVPCTVANGLASYDDFEVDSNTDATDRITYYRLALTDTGGEFVDYIAEKLRVPASSPISLDSIIFYTKHGAMPTLEAPDLFEEDATGTTGTISWAVALRAVRYRVYVNSILATTVTAPQQYVATGLLPESDNTFVVGAVDENGNEELSAPLVVHTLAGDTLAPLKINVGLGNNSLTNGWVGDLAFTTSTGGRNTDLTAVDTSGVPDNVPPAVVLSSYSAQPTLTIPGHTPGKPYELWASFLEINAAHVIGDSIFAPYVNGVLATPIGDPSPYFDVLQEAGLVLHKLVRKKFLAIAKADGTIVFQVTNGVNNTQTDIRLFALERYEAAPVAAMTVHVPANQTLPVVFNDTSTPRSTARTFNFGDGDSSPDGTVAHKFASAGDYAPSLVPENAQGTGRALSQTITIPSLVALTATPANIPAANVGATCALALGATGGTGPYTHLIVPESVNALEYTAIGGGNFWMVQRRGYTAGLSILNATYRGIYTALQPWVFAFIGDSTSVGFAEPSGEPLYNAPYTPAAALAKYLPYGSTVYSYGVTGSTIEQATAAYAAGAGTRLTGNEVKRGVIARTGVNNALAGDTAAQMATKYQTLVNTIAATNPGVPIIACNIGVAGGYVGGPLQTVIEAFNTKLIDGTITGITAVIDIRGDRIYGYGANNRLWWDGSPHNTRFGYPALVGDKIAPVVLNLPNIGSGVGVTSIHRWKEKIIDTFDGSAVTVNRSITVTQ